jgi:hypothetical protein
MLHHLIRQAPRLAVTAVLVAVMIWTPAVALAWDGDTTLDPASIDAFVTAYMRRTGLPEAAVAVVQVPLDAPAFGVDGRNDLRAARGQLRDPPFERLGAG